MNCKIPFTKNIDFERKLHEITSISLEHEIKVEEDILKGNFIVSGDFKSHEVSVNKEAFSYILPFEITISPEIDKDTIEFMIDDFTYEIIDNHILKVNIDFNVLASQKEVEELDREEIFQDASALFNEEEESALLVQEKEHEQEEIEEVKDGQEAGKTEEIKENIDEEERNIQMVSSVEEKKKIEKETQDTIVNNISGNDEEYATYHIHMVSDGESVETICTMYNSNLNILADYNELNELCAGDKLIIPEKDE